MSSPGSPIGPIESRFMPHRGEKGDKGDAGLSAQVRRAIVFLFVLAVMLAAIGLIAVVREQGTLAAQQKALAVQQKELTRQAQAGDRQRCASDRAHKVGVGPQRGESPFQLWKLGAQ